MGGRHRRGARCSLCSPHLLLCTLNLKVVQITFGHSFIKTSSKNRYLGRGFYPISIESLPSVVFLIASSSSSFLLYQNKTGHRWTSGLYLLSGLITWSFHIKKFHEFRSLDCPYLPIHLPCCTWAPRELSPEFLLYKLKIVDILNGSFFDMQKMSIFNFFWGCRLVHFSRLNCHSLILFVICFKINFMWTKISFLFHNVIFNLI